MDIVKVAVIGIAGVMLSIIMKNSRSEYAQLVALVTAAVEFYKFKKRIKIELETVQHAVLENYTKYKIYNDEKYFVTRSREIELKKFYKSNGIKTRDRYRWFAVFVISLFYLC